MSGYLIDTHVWFWLLFEDSALSTEHRASLTQWQRDESLYLSAISVWEAAQKQRNGKLHLSGTVEQWIEISTGDGRLQLLDLTIPILIEANRLPGEIHGDPADRMLAATARLHDLTLVTHDTSLRQYAKLGHLRVHKV